MKRRISLITATTLCIFFFHVQQAISQSDKIRFGLQAGLNFQNNYGKDQFDNTLNNDILIAYSIGLKAEIPVISKFYFKPGLMLSIKGAKSTEIIQTKTNNITRRISYLELPLNIIYKSVLGNGHILLGAGPYLAFGLGGSSKYIDSSSSHIADIKFENLVTATAPLHVDYFRPLDIGINILVGYEFTNHFSFQLNAQIGFTKINPEDERIFNDHTDIKNIGFGISVEYRL